MPKPSKARKSALQREEKRRLEREANLRDTLSQPVESPTTETQVPQPRGGSRTSKWRDENEKTKKSRAARMQPSVLKFFYVSNRVFIITGPRKTHPNLLVDGQPIGAKGIGIEHGSEGGGSGLVPEVSAGSLRSDMPVNPPFATPRPPR